MNTTVNTKEWEEGIGGMVLCVVMIAIMGMMRLGIGTKRLEGMRSGMVLRNNKATMRTLRKRRIRIITDTEDTRRTSNRNRRQRIITIIAHCGTQLQQR